MSLVFWNTSYSKHLIRLGRWEQRGGDHSDKTLQPYFDSLLSEWDVQNVSNVITLAHVLISHHQFDTISMSKPGCSIAWSAVVFLWKLIIIYLVLLVFICRWLHSHKLTKSLNIFPVSPWEVLAVLYWNHWTSQKTWAPQCVQCSPGL